MFAAVEDKKRVSPTPITLDEDSWSYAIVEHEDYIRFIVLGRLSHAVDVIRLSEVVIMAARVREASRILLDMRALPARFGDDAIPFLASQLDRGQHRAQGLRVACLGTSETIAALKTTEKMLQAISLDYNTYMNEYHALAWLLADK